MVLQSSTIGKECIPMLKGWWHYYYLYWQYTFSFTTNCQLGRPAINHQSWRMYVYFMWVYFLLAEQAAVLLPPHVPQWPLFLHLCHNATAAVCIINWSDFLSLECVCGTGYLQQSYACLNNRCAHPRAWPLLLLFLSNRSSGAIHNWRYFSLQGVSLIVRSDQETGHYTYFFVRWCHFWTAPNGINANLHHWKSDLGVWFSHTVIDCQSTLFVSRA